MINYSCCLFAYMHQENSFKYSLGKPRYNMLIYCHSNMPQNSKMSLSNHQFLLQTRFTKHCRPALCHDCAYTGHVLEDSFYFVCTVPEVTSILTEPIICSTHSFTEFVLDIFHNGQYLMKMKIEKKNLNNSQFCKGSGKNIMMRCDVYMWSMPVLLLFDTVSRFSVCLHCRLASQTCTRPSSFNF